MWNILFKAPVRLFQPRVSTESPALDDSFCTSPSSAPSFFCWMDPSFLFSPFPSCSCLASCLPGTHSQMKNFRVEHCQHSSKLLEQVPSSQVDSRTLQPIWCKSLEAVPLFLPSWKQHGDCFHHISNILVNGLVCVIPGFCGLYLATYIYMYTCIFEKWTAKIVLQNYQEAKCFQKSCGKYKQDIML